MAVDHALEELMSTLGKSSYCEQTIQFLKAKFVIL